MSRKTAREVAMMQTYEKIFGCDDTYVDVLEKSGIAEEPTEADIDYAASIVDGVHANLEIINDQITAHSKGWSLDRMSRVDLSIMRNAVYEILFDEHMDDAVSINEAVNLAKIYSDESSPRFINGVLGSIARDKRKEEDGK